MEMHEGAALKHSGQMAELPLAKRARFTSDGDGVHQKQRNPNAGKLSRESYTVGWICALPVELAAARAMLDYEHADLEADPIDSNTYTLGTIGRHNMVIACLPSGHYGTNNAAAVASSMSHAFRSLRFRLMVGIGGGVPGDDDLRLGDVVVGRTVTQYDFGKANSGNEFKCMGTPVKPPHALMTAVSKLQAEYCSGRCQIPAILEKFTKAPISMNNYSRPKELQDDLFCSSYEHVKGMDDCRLCELSNIVDRPPRNDDQPVIHFGDIASGNQVIKDAQKRDRIAQMLYDKHNLKVRSFEMEAAGMVDHFPCLVIRGICDYSDSHKNKGWQKYAAATAAAFAREFIDILPANEGGNMPIPCAPNTDVSPVISLEDRLKSLTFPEIDSRHDNIKAAHAKTCQWLLIHPGYICWMDPDKFEDHKGFLWIKGKPGTGKSTIMKFAYINTVKSYAAERTAIISFFFNARGVDLEKSTEGMYRSLIVQLLQRFPDLQDAFEASNHCLRATIQTHKWELNHLQNIFASAVTKLNKRHLICFIDALDECDEDQVREMLEYFEDLGGIAAEEGTKVYICFSSRHYPNISLRAGIELTLEVEQGHAKDLEDYVLNRTRNWHPSIAIDVRAEILRKAAGIFMWVILVVSILNKEIEQGRMFAVRDRLHGIPSKLSDLFRDILGRDEKNPKDLILCLRWILFAKRPLRDDEFYFAMASGSNRELKEWDPDTVPREAFHQFVLSSSKGLAEVTQSQDRSVQFIHESVRDFLTKDGGFDNFLPGLANEFEDSSHEKLRECCYKYLTSNAHYIQETYKKPDWAIYQGRENVRDEICRRFPFFEYATRFLFYHADTACTRHRSQTDFIRDLHLEKWIYVDDILQEFGYENHNVDTSLLYIFAIRGYANLIAYGIHLTPWFNIPGGQYGYPILAAISKGHRKAVEALVCHGEPTTPTEDILACFEYGQYAEVEIYGECATTLLHWACQKGYLPFVKLLILSKEFNINDQDYEGFTALEVAAIHSQIATVKYLRSTGAVIDPKRLLELAIERNVEDLAAFVLDSNVDLINMCVRGLRPLDWAIDRGSIDLVKLCLEKGADTSIQEYTGLTPLNRAVQKGSDGFIDITKLLLEKGADVSEQDVTGDTPLHWAAQNGFVKITKMLLESGADALMTDNDGNTALHWAAQNGFVKITKMLLERGADALMPDKYGTTALHWAARIGFVEITKLLLERGADALMPDNDGNTALHWAAQNKSVEITKMLLKNGADALQQDITGSTPLYWAAWSGSVEITKMLLKSGADASMPGKNGNTPLHLASSHGHLAIVEILLKSRANVAATNFKMERPLHLASEKGYLNIAKFLIEKGADIKALTDQGETALDVALREKHAITAEMLLEHGAEPSSTNPFSLSKWPSLHRASSLGCFNLVKLLVFKGTDVNGLDDVRNTALEYAFRHRHLDIVAFLTKARAETIQAASGRPLLK